MDKKQTAPTDKNKKGKKVDDLKAEEVERRNAPVTLTTDGDGLLTGKLKPRDRV